ncbi:MAG: UbiA family prenyltransferase, partial [Calditrichia bacterium]
MKKFLAAFWEFTRPHTIIGTSLSLFGLFIIAQAAAGYRTLDLAAFILALVSCLGANIYIVGLNQLQDVEIDRINKPYLPLAAG